MIRASSGLLTSSELEAQQLSANAFKLAKDKHFDMAISLATNAIKLAANSSIGSNLYCNRSILYFIIGKLQNSLDDTNIALALSPGNPKLLQRKVLTLTKMGRFDEAMTVLTEIRQVDCHLADTLKLKVVEEKNATLHCGIIGNLPRSVSKSVIRDIINQKCGTLPIRDVNFINEDERVSCIVEFTDMKVAKELLFLQNYPYGSPLQVKLISKTEANLLLAEKAFIPELQSLDGDSESVSSIETHGNSSNGQQECFPLRYQQSPQETSVGADIFVGNVPSYSTVSELKEFILLKMPELTNFEVCKKPDWDYCFINLLNGENAKTLINKINGQAFDNTCRLEARLRDSKPFEQKYENCTTLCVTPIPQEPLHVLLNDLYEKITPKIKSDFALYCQDGWKHFFLNFESSFAAMEAYNLIKYSSVDLRIKLQKNNKFDPNASHVGSERFNFSLTIPSKWLRLDNVDGKATDEEVRTLFQAKPKALFRDYDFSVAYLSFESSDIAKNEMERVQGQLLLKSKLAVRFSVLKKL